MVTARGRCGQRRGICSAFPLAMLALAAQSLTGGAAIAGGAPVVTQPPQSQSPDANAREAVGADEVDGPTILDSVPFLHGLDAVRDALRDRVGIYIHGTYLGDPYADIHGGLRRGATYNGRLDAQLDIDSQKTVGLPGGTLHANMFQIDGRDLSRDNVGNLLSIDDIAALPSTRLYELWYEQKLGDKASLRVGQQGIDVEFLTSNYAGAFINSSFGWPALTSADLPDGGPAYPLATPALRLKLSPSANLSILAAVFDGEPAGRCNDDPQTCDRRGLNFRVSDPPLAFVETQFRYGQSAAAPLLPGTLKLGAFWQFAGAADQRSPIAAPAPQGAGGIAMPLALTPAGGAYAIIDQTVYRVPGDDPDDGVGVFARIIGAPSARSPIDLYADAGISALGLVPGRPHDLFGLAAAVARFSGQAPPPATQGRAFEAAIELTYQAELIPGIAAQPTFQYIVHPSATISGQSAPIPDAAVFGVTMITRF